MATLVNLTDCMGPRVAISATILTVYVLPEAVFRSLQELVSRSPLLDHTMALKLKKISVAAAMLAIQSIAVAEEPGRFKLCDTADCDTIACDELPDSSLFPRLLRGCESPCLFSDFRYRTPAMMGDFFGGSPLGFRGNTVIDRAFIVADDLDAPLVLPALVRQ